MRRTIAVASAISSAITCLSAQELSLSTTVGWESEYIFRGAKVAEEIFTPSIDLTYRSAYLGIWGALPVEGFSNEIDIYAGYGLEVGKIVNLDLGVTYYTYPEQDDAAFFANDNSVEFYAGAAVELLLTPSLYVYYDIDLDVFTVEGSIGHRLPVTESLSLNVGAYAGWANRKDEDEYTYYGLSADFVLSINQGAWISAGVRWAGASEAYMWEDHELDDPDDESIWFGASFTTGF